MNDRNEFLGSDSTSASGRGRPDGGFHGLLRIMIPVAVVAGAVGSVGLMRRSGEFQGSVFVPFAVWVLSPFVILILANMVSKRWSVLTRTTLHCAMLILTAVSLAIYGHVVLMPPDLRTATPFLVVPLGSLWLLMIIIPIAALKSGTLLRMRLVRWLLKAIAAVGILSFLGVASLLGLLWLDHNRETKLPTPTGPFAVSRTTYVWSDPSHSDPLALPGSKRELFVWIWYPAEPRQPSQTLDDYLPAPWRAAVEHQRGVTKFLSRDLSRIRVNSIRDAVVSSQQHSYPVVLMSGGPTSFTSLAEDLASHGYVVMGFDAPYRSSVVVFPDGRVIARAPQNDVDSVSGNQQEQLASKLVQTWSADMSFALDQLEQLNTSDPSGRFLGRLDMQRVGAFGHSFGGATVLQFCHDDLRCKAVIDVDGIPFGSVVHEGVTVPVMFLMSDHTRDAAGPEDAQIEANFRSIFARLPSDHWSEIMIKGSNHYMFSDDAVLRSLPLVRVLRALGIVGIDGRRQIALTDHYISTFFDVYLKGAPVSELKSQPKYPEVEYIH
jgi:predicted dienelactone hydrolase